MVETRSLAEGWDVGVIERDEPKMTPGGGDRPGLPMVIEQE